MKVISPVPRHRSRIEIIPLIDIMFFLLAAFMMVSLNMSKLTAVKVDAPPALTGGKDIKEEIFNVSIDRSGAMFVGETSTTPADLGALITNRFLPALSETEIPVYVTADRDTPHGAVLLVLETLRRAGIQRVAFAVSPARPDDLGTP